MIMKYIVVSLFHSDLFLWLSCTIVIMPVMYSYGRLL